MRVETIKCDACGLPIAPGELSLPLMRRPRTIQELWVASALGANSVVDDGVFVSGHLHQHCRDELQTALDELAEAMRERAQADLATLRAAFEGSPDE